jgi:hypothetical protein
MADKSGTLQQQRNACFPTTTAKATGGCPLTGPDVAIVPMRYALDRSRYDENPKKLKPLLKSAKWATLPALKTRDYTLRQLYDGYVYVYDETAKTFHEYEFSSSNGVLTRIKLTDEDKGKDQRKSEGEGKNHLIYPRKNTLRIAYSPMQWTWRICEHMRSNPNSRKHWMKTLDLPTYCITMSAPGTLPLLSVADAVADVDKGAVTADKRFADSAIPPFAPKGKCNGKPIFSTLASDVYWTGSVTDKNSALIIALDDRLAVLNDLGMQLAADQAAYQSWQQEHEHKIQIAQTVEALCGANMAQDKVPSFIRGDAIKTRQYQRDLDAYYAEKKSEEKQALLNAASGSPSMMSLGGSFKAVEMADAIKTKYRTSPTESDYQEWSDRGKWRREVDLDGAHAYIQSHQQNGDSLLKQVQDTQDDFRDWAEFIGNEPLRVFIDTTNTQHLHYLQNVIAHLLVVYGQDMRCSTWLAEQDTYATTLFGTVRYGFSPGLKDALDTQANLLLNGMGDMTNLATRVGELNGMLDHQGFAEKKWMKELKEPVQQTFKAMRELASKEGKASAEAILMALVPSDSRLASGKTQNIGALVRNLLIGQVLLNSSERPAIDGKVAEKLNTWKREWMRLQKQVADTRKQWAYPDRNGQRRGLARVLQTQETKLQLHELKIPGILDYQNNKYAELLRDEIRKFAISGADAAKNWSAKAKAWSAKWGGNAGLVTWGVVLLNFINTALTYRDLTKDGNLSKKDITQVSYGLGYSFNLLMVVYIETPWQIIKNAQPVLIADKEVGILSRSAAYWAAEGNTVWATALRGFSLRMVGVGAFAVVASTLEFFDLLDDLEDKKTQEERIAMGVKIFAVGGMGILGALQLCAAFTLSPFFVSMVMNPWFAVAALIVGVIYLLASVVLSYFKSDGIGGWLRKCCWSNRHDSRHPDTPDGQAEENRSLLEIQMSPQVFVKSTVERKDKHIPGKGVFSVTVQNGAWIQILLPSTVRGQFVQFNVIDSKRPLGLLPVTKMDDPVQDPFLDKGQFKGIESFKNVTNIAYKHDPRAVRHQTLQSDDNVLWQTWVPVSENADFIELQIWYPSRVLNSGIDDHGYLYQLELDTDGAMKTDGLSTSMLEVKQANRKNALVLVVPD